MRALKRCYPSQHLAPVEWAILEVCLRLTHGGKNQFLLDGRTMAGKFGYRCSKDIVYRAVKQLERSGWLVREGGGERNEGGMYDKTKYRVLDHAQWVQAGHVCQFCQSSVVSENDTSRRPPVGSAYARNVYTILPVIGKKRPNVTGNTLSVVSENDTSRRPPVAPVRQDQSQNRVSPVAPVRHSFVSTTSVLEPSVRTTQGSDEQETFIGRDSSLPSKTNGTIPKANYHHLWLYLVENGLEGWREAQRDSAALRSLWNAATGTPAEREEQVKAAIDEGLSRRGHDDPDGVFSAALWFLERESSA